MIYYFKHILLFFLYLFSFFCASFFVKDVSIKFFSCKFFFISVPFDMVYIPGDFYGLFFKENNNVSTREVRSFLLDKYPITNEDFYKFILLDDKWSPLKINSFFSNKDYLLHWLLNENFSLIAKNPLVNVSWYTANEYCKVFGKRLPTLDEWEYVSSISEFFPGKHIDNFFYMQKILNWYINSFIFNTYDIRYLFGNYWNIFGLHGVIWEWVYDFNSIILIGSDFGGKEQDQVLFCGAAASNSVNPIDYVGFLRFIFRSNLESTYSLTSLGFRCAKSVFV